MKVSAGRLLEWLLGRGWSFKAEHAAAFEIAAALKVDWGGRIGVLLALPVLSLWIVHPLIVLAWCFLILLMEWLERRYAFCQSLDAPFGGQQLLLLILQRTTTISVYIVAGLAFVAEGPIHRLLGLCLLIGYMIHVALLYNVSRIQTLAAGIPVFAGFTVAVVITLFDSSITPYEKSISVFAIIAIATYMLIATHQNMQMRERLRSLMNEKAQLADEDPLTGLHNRRSFVDLLTAHESAGGPLTLVFIDLDRFKPLNDKYGHAVGDAVLKETGRRLVEQPNMLGAARLGGDEFAILFGELAEAPATDHLMLALHNCLIAPMHCAACDVSVGASIGWVSARGGSMTVSEMLHSADTAMRRAKVEHLGVTEFNPLTDADSLVSSAIEIGFRRALANGQIQAALQPIVSVSSGDVVTMELLARWRQSGFPRDPSPQDFIPIAERLGLLNDLLWSTLQQALPALLGSTWSLAINVSASQLTSENFLHNLCSVIAQHGIPAHRIEIEVTETVAMRNVSENCAVLDEARARGFLVALDDFGAGYSSLAVLNRLPLDKIKLDRSLIGELSNCASTQKVLKAALLLARELGMTTTVEGIECAESAAIVSSLGCDQMQGYWLGMPELVGSGSE